MGKKSTEYNSANDPFTFTSPSTGAKKSSSADAPTTTAPAPDAEPAKASLDSKNHRLEIPPGVPEYNFRMCQNEIIAMGKKNQALTFDQPLNQSKFPAPFLDSESSVLSFARSSSPIRRALDWIR